MNLRYQGMLSAIEQGVRCGKLDRNTGRELYKLFQGAARAGWSIVHAHAVAVERRLLPPLRQGVTPE